MLPSSRERRQQMTAAKSQNKDEEKKTKAASKKITKKTTAKKPAAKKSTVKKPVAKKAAGKKVVKHKEEIKQENVEIKQEQAVKQPQNNRVETVSQKTAPKEEPKAEYKTEKPQEIKQEQEYETKPEVQEVKQEQKPVQKQQEKAPVVEEKPKEKVIKILGQPTIKELAEKMDYKINDFIKKLMGMGIFATINQKLEPDMMELVLAECGFKAEITQEFAAEEIASQEEDKPEDLAPRAPVVTIMGHVDHGKTSLLDAIRHSNVVAGEFGAITQHIGAYRVKTSRGYISFLDTPGHEAFTAMRARGAQATDIVILVVSATDGIMPQTIEAINHAQSAKAPIIVAVNKIDLPGANPERIKQDLAGRGLVPEEWQGNTIFVEISAKKRINIEKLLEMVSIQAEMMELKANPKRKAIGVILESKRDNKRGVVATVLVQKGTLKVGDPFIVGTTYGRVRALIDEHGHRMQSAGPSVPAEVLGINGEPPVVGETLYVAESDKEAKHISEKRKLAHKAENIEHQKHVSLTNLKSADGKKIKELAIILKADVQGSIEAIKDAILGLSNDEVQVKIIHSAAGDVNESDLLLAKASDAVIISFNVNTIPAVSEEAEKEGIEIRNYNIIFELLEDLKAAMEGLLEPEIIEEVVGRATVRQVFDLSSGFIAGSYVEEGKITRNFDAKIMRGGEQIHKGKIGGLKRFKDDVKEVEKGYECGILIEGFRGTKAGDTVLCVQKKTITRRITKPE